MSDGLLILIIFLCFFVLVLFEVPIGWSIAITATLYVLYSGVPLSVIPQTMYTAQDSFTLISIPMFMASGAIMSKGGLSPKLVKIANACVGHIFGGLAMTASVACAMFGAISGSANATSAAIGGIVMPAMKENGYDPDWTTAYTASSAILGTLIPPSISLIIYGSLTGQSISTMFMASIVPGVLLCLGYCIYAYIHAKKTGEGMQVGQKFSFKALIDALKDGILALLMPVIILGGVFSGIFTATESAAVGVLYGIIVALFIYKTMTVKEMLQIMGESMLGCAAISIILQSAGLFGWMLTALRIPQTVVEVLLGFTSSPIGILIMLNIVFLILGTFMETIAAIMMMVPIILPVLNATGIDPAFFGVVMCTNLAVGMITPPLGATLFVTSNVSGVPVSRVIRHLPVLLCIMIGVVFLITFVPDVVMFLPKMFG